jgi:hypothetical protein
MPALTYFQVASSLGTYKDPNVTLMDALNQVIPRLYSMGVYRDLTIQYQLPIYDGCITLPNDAESVLMFQLNGTPSAVRSMWHDFSAAGMSGGIDPALFGLVDAGYHPTMRSVTANISSLYITSSAYDLVKDAVDLGGAILSVVGTDGNAYYLGTVSGSTITFSTPVSSIVSIKYYQVSEEMPILDIRTVANDSTTTLATVGPAATTTRYRRYRIPATAADTTAHVLVKRAFEPLVSESDAIYISNVAALKHGLLALVAEDNADLLRAKYHWEESQRNMELEMESARGAAIPNISFDILGIGGRSSIRTML